MIQQIFPDYQIKIGIKQGRVVGCDFSEALKYEGVVGNEEMLKKIAIYLTEAIEMLQPKERTQES